MKIDFSQIELNKTKTDIRTATKAQNTATLSMAGGVVADLSGNTGISESAYTKKTRSLADKLESIGSYNEKNERNYMAVMSNTLSDKDYQELINNGYAPGQMEIKDAVTSLDRMKVKLSQAGVNVEGYTDTVSSDKVEEITGTAAVSAALKNADLPVTDDNVKGVQEALSIASELKPLNDASMKYMIENDMEPTIANVYSAQFSAGDTVPLSSGGYFSSDGTGAYLAQAAVTSDNIISDPQIKEQIDNVIKQAGLTVSDDTEKDAEKLISEGIPLNTDTLIQYTDLKKTDIKADIKEITAAVTDGKRPVDAYLIRDYKNIKAERQLKETELSMTADANLKLLGSDYAIDTSSLENEVEGLKTKEKNLWDLLDETLSTAADIKSQPADIIAELAFDGKAVSGIQEEKEKQTYGSAQVQEPDSLSTPVIIQSADISENINSNVQIKGTKETSLNEVHTEGIRLQNLYEKAEKTYEAVGTEVRSDLGDNINKAFQNVDDILDDLKLETNDTNRRAVRILGYTQMEITTGNIEKIKTEDTKVNTLIDNLTPKNVLKLIRENINPLETDIDTLSEKINEYSAEDEKETDRFSDYVVKLRNSGEITVEEETSYIGIYRLVDKLVKTDGAAVGALVNSNTDVNMKNLLTAIRTKKKGFVDVTVDDSFGEVSAVKTTGEQKIDTEIKTAFSRESNEDGTQKFTDAAKVEEYIYKMLRNSDVSVTADNINAAAMMMGNKGSFAKGLFENTNETSRGKIKKTTEKLLDKMDDEDSTKEAYDELTDVEELATMEGEHLDLRLMQSYHKVMSLQKTLADAENYTIPVEIDGEITSINLQIKHGEIGGKVDIICESEKLGNITAGFTVTKNSTEGMAVCSDKAGMDYITARADKIAESIRAISEEEKTVTLDVIQDTAKETVRPVNATDGDNTTDTAELYRIAKAFIGGIIHENQQ